MVEDLGLLLVPVVVEVAAAALVTVAKVREAGARPCEARHLKKEEDKMENT